MENFNLNGREFIELNQLMNYPVASSGVSEKFELIVTMQNLIIFLTLIMDITSDSIFIPMTTNCACKIAIAPKLTAP